MKIPFPIRIGKQSSPYMYRAEQSGIMVNKYGIEGTTGISIPVNPDGNADHSILSLQVWIKSPYEFTEDVPILNINGSDVSVEVHAIFNTSNRAIVTTSIDVDIYQNGIKTKAPILEPGIWTSLYFAFREAIAFDDTDGNIYLFPGFVFDNISEYIYENPIEEDSRTVYLAWAQVLTPDFDEPDTHNTWGDIEAMGSWEDATTTTVTINDYFIDGSYLYNDQVGASVIVIEDTASVGIFDNGVDVFTNVEWTTIERPLV